jgi:hypothetical protein
MYHTLMAAERETTEGGISELLNYGVVKRMVFELNPVLQAAPKRAAPQEATRFNGSVKISSPSEETADWTRQLYQQYDPLDLRQYDPSDTRSRVLPGAYNLATLNMFVVKLGTAYNYPIEALPTNPYTHIKLYYGLKSHLLELDPTSLQSGDDTVYYLTRQYLRDSIGDLDKIKIKPRVTRPTNPTGVSAALNRLRQVFRRDQ